MRQSTGERLQLAWVVQRTNSVATFWPFTSHLWPVGRSGPLIADPAGKSDFYRDVSTALSLMRHAIFMRHRLVWYMCCSTALRWIFTRRPDNCSTCINSFHCGLDGGGRVYPSLAAKGRNLLETWLRPAAGFPKVEEKVRARPISNAYKSAKPHNIDWVARLAKHFIMGASVLKRCCFFQRTSLYLLQRDRSFFYWASRFLLTV